MFGAMVLILALMALVALVVVALIWAGLSVAERRGWQYVVLARYIVEGVALFALGWAVFGAWRSGFGAALLVLGLAAMFVALVRVLSGRLLRIYDKKAAARV